ncbi:MAG: sorbosone dehydrogenase family protein [Dehalococcoidia bacterium]
MRHPRLVLPVLTGVSLVALVALAACGGASSTTPDATSAPSTPSATPSAAAPATGAAGTPRPGEPSRTPAPTGATGASAATGATGATGGTGATSTPAGGGGTTATPAPAASAGPPRPVSLAPISSRSWNRPTEAGPYPSASGGPAGLFVAEQEGVIYEVAAGGAVSTILDLRGVVLRSGNEEGLLSVALDPAFADNRHVWVYYSAGSPRRTVLSRFTRDAGAATISRGSELVILEVAQPYANHNGGAVRFGPDGMLYLGLGDGGSGGDPQGNGQDRSTLLGSVIRIDVRNASAERPYAIPSDNPFVGQSSARNEIWAFGLRNPWRMAFDPATGALWAGDVGQGAVEEIDLIRSGGNYGWNIMEGDRCYRPSSGCDRGGLIAPVVTYAHESGRCSIVGGYVYHGSAVPEIAGAYVYGDTCSGEIWAVNAASPGTPVRIATGARNMTSFGLDAAGEVLVLTFGQPIRRLVSP